MNLQLRGTFQTDSGMFGVWDSHHFSSINDYDTWELELLEDEDIQLHIAARHFVPINIHSDGVFEFAVRVGETGVPSSLSAREKQYLTVSSEAYLFRSTGEANISGIEFVAAAPEGNVGTLKIPSGDYTVTVHLIAWDEEPGARDTQGNPIAEALPDFVILLNPSDGTAQSYRNEINTFDERAA
jgi:hypothetical protein